MRLPPRRQGSPGLLPACLLLSLLPSPSFLAQSPEEKKKPGATGNLLSNVCAFCHANATCKQQDGKYTCICNYGFVGNGRTHCEDKNECLIGTIEICGEHSLCHNTPGSFYCVCLEGYKASNNNSEFIPNDGTHCIDIDECEVSDICGHGGLCVNTLGSYKCSCAEGYTTENGTETFYPPTDRMSCKEIDCGKPLVLPNTDIIWDNTTTLGSVVYYKCKKGFQSVGKHNFSQCTVTAQWENITIECKEVENGALKEPRVPETTKLLPASCKDCGQPPLIPDSEMEWNKTSQLGSVVDYKCSKGFYATSMKTRSHCTCNGSWEILDLRCKKERGFFGFAANGSCLTWRRHHGSQGINETYRLTMRVLGPEFRKTPSELKINLTTAEEAVKMCLPLHPHENYSIKIEEESSNLVSTFSLLNLEAETEVVFGNISVFNGTCIKWQRKSGRTQSEDTYVFHIRGRRWYQKEFLHAMTLNFAVKSQTPALCLNLHPGSNYTVNISTASLDHSVLVYMATPITDPQSPEVEFISAEGSAPVFNLRKAEESNGPISSYQVIVVPWSPLCNFNCYSLTSLTYFSNSTDSDGYVAAEFPAKVLNDNGSAFALGDRLYYGKFYNAPLKQRRDYCVILRTISEWDEVRTQSCIAWAQIKDVSSVPQRMTALMFGSVATVCSILLLSLFTARATVHASQAVLVQRTLSEEVRLLSTKHTITFPSEMTQAFSRV